MKFTVVWKPTVKDQLADIWVSAPDRAAVSAAANQIDQLLKFSPEAQGESRLNDERILILSPLVVLYEIHMEDLRVDVLAIRHLPVR